ncbi:sensor histidine kinase [Neptunomonas phycophila]|uniref:sensor histidine kinase n=1 Tax=Neptunomonas phycophila TaxID=1572645 RepID=UPI0009488F51|nr:HAMP domain-containing sensor histidine kinase [Neptunomonas phycophila]
MTLLSSWRRRFKRLSYTQRVMLAIGSYTFSIMLVVMLGIWAFIEYSETDDEREIALAIHEAVGLLAQAPQNSANTPIHTSYFDLYLSQAQLPATIQQSELAPGLTPLESGGSLWVSINPATQQPYFLLFHANEESNLIETEFDDILFIVAAVVLSTLLTLLMVRWMAKSLAAPVVSLTRQVEHFDINQGNFPRLDRDDEIGQLSHAFGDLIQRMHQFMKREQDFTRFASHELRSPITVIRGNLDILQESLPDNPIHERIVTRMNTAIQRVSLLIDGFLWLGREKHNTNMPIETVNAAQLRTLLNSLTEHLAPESRARLSCEVGEIHWHIRPLMLSILLDNLLRNALQHSDQSVSLNANGQKLTITNPISNAIDGEQQGVGLQIVNRICEASRWDYDINQSGNCFSFSVTIRDIAATE